MEIDALYHSGTADSITAAFAVSSILVLCTIVLLIIRCALENLTKKRRREGMAGPAGGTGNVS